MKKRAGFLSALAIIAVFNGCAGFNSYRDTGRLALTGLHQPVRVVRDGKGMPYIYAASLPDAFRAMGFVTAQDRLFQMELTRMLAAGRIAELVGEEALGLDRRMRTIGIRRLAQRQARLMQEDASVLLKSYYEGINAFVAAHPDDHHLEFKLAGIRPAPWSLTDILSVMYYMSWSTSANIQTEIITQMLVDRLGPEKAQSLMPLNINPDEDAGRQRAAVLPTHGIATLGLQNDPALMGYLMDGPLTLSSNNWAAGPDLSTGGKPIVANDPHLDAGMLPGPWFPCGLMTPELRIVGAHIPGLPVMPIFRNEVLAAGITNAYCDVQDLYVETVDPSDGGRYLEGSRSLPFEVIRETLRYRDDAAPEGFSEQPLTIRLTRRGPIVSDVLPGLETDRLLSLRWAAAEVMDADSDFARAMQARSADEFREALRHWKTIQLNFVFGDCHGNIGWQVSGSLPRRSEPGGTIPRPVGDGWDNWRGWVPFEDLPRADNPEKGWIGTCNHKTVGSDYPYYYSSYFATSYRYRRLTALMAGRSVIGVDDHLGFQRDTRNVMAETLAPIMARILLARDDTRAMGAILSDWDFEDRPDQAAPTIFHAVYDRWALRVFQDELGETLARRMLATWYFWQERFQHMVQAGHSPWFDDVETAGVRETMADILYLAAVEAQSEMAARLGKDMARWHWGRVHTIEFLSPIRRTGLGKGLLGGGRHPVGGSGETLRRGQYDYNRPFAVSYAATLRMVADLSDSEKVLAVIPGGVSGRIFHPHTRDQLATFIGGGKQYWWFSDDAIRAHAQSELTLDP